MQQERKAATRKWAHKRGLNTKIHLAVDAMVCRSNFITQGTTADCAQAGRLIEGITAEHLIAERV